LLALHVDRFFIRAWLDTNEDRVIGPAIGYAHNGVLHFGELGAAVSGDFDRRFGIERRTKRRSNYDQDRFNRVTQHRLIRADSILVLACVSAGDREATRWAE